MTPLIATHALFAGTACVIGLFVFVNKKGTGMHRWAGRFFVLCMLVASITAFWIREINDGQFSLIHLLIPFTIGSIGWAIFSIRRFAVNKDKKWYAWHRNTMISLYIGACVIAGGFTFLPGRQMNKWLMQLLFGA